VRRDVLGSKRSIGSQRGSRSLCVDKLVRDEWKDVAEALLQDALGNMDLLLAAAKVVAQGRRWVETQVFAYQVPTSLQILGASSKFEVVDVHAEKQSQLLVYEDALPSFKSLESDL
jgi:hypothetical protein